MQGKQQVMDFEAWTSRAARAERRAKLLSAKLSAQELTEVANGKPLTVEQAEKLLSQRKAGKLKALVKIAKRGFNKRFKQVGKYRYCMIE